MSTEKKTGDPDPEFHRTSPKQNMSKLVALLVCVLGVAVAHEQSNWEAPPMCHRLAALKSLPPVTPQTILNSFEKGQHLTEVSQKWRSWLSADNSSMPQQVHIALNNDCTQMVVNWATLMPGVADGEVQWWPAEQPRPAQTVSAKAEISTYNAGSFVHS
jgi:hypothetical protein